MDRHLFQYRYLFPIIVSSVVFLITANICCAKFVQVLPSFTVPAIVLGGYTLVQSFLAIPVLPGGTLFYPITFVFSDMLTEVYGVKAARKAIWAGFWSMVAVSACIFIVKICPAPPYWENQEAFNTILGWNPVINFASIIANVAGELVNSQVMAREKKKAARKGLDPNAGMRWRYVKSTIFGQAVDSALFISIAFSGTGASFATLFGIFAFGWSAKVAWEFVASFISVPLTKRMKEIEELHVSQSALVMEGG